MTLSRVFHKWRLRCGKNVWRVIMGFTVVGIGSLLMLLRNSGEQENSSSRSDLEHAQYDAEDESDPEDGWSPIDSVWSDAMATGSFYLGTRDNVSIVLWKPGMRPANAKRPFGRTKKGIERPVYNMSREAQEKYFSLKNVSKKYAKSSSSTWNNWPINTGALKELRKLADGLHPLHGMDNREVIASSNLALPCGKGRRTCKLDGHNDIRHYQTCAVVGNSGILTDSLCGVEIDAHDYVIRFGVGPTVGYEDDVGTKKNVTILNRDILLKINESFYLGGSKDAYSQRLRQLNVSILMFARSGRRREWTNDYQCLIKIARKHKLAFTLKTYKAGNLADTIRNTITATMPDLALELKDVETTGMLQAMFTALTFCKRINLYGFYPFHTDKHGRDIGYSYYPDKNAKPDRVHNFSVEYAVSQRYDKLGVVRHVIDRCQQTPLADKLGTAGSGKLTSAKSSSKNSRVKKVKRNR
ncbi:CMP-N-acetylneuraminate-poly-alpha-2,8-sialyltransferase-like [Branchiostoma floridae x Branchiostoma japonicum]